MKLFRKSLMLILLFVICLGISSGIMSNAKEITLDVPTIKVKTVNDGSDIEITIEETKDAEGYEIYVSNNWDIYKDFQESNENEFQKVLTVEQDGSSKRKVYLNSFLNGKYTIKVCSYNSKKYGTMKYSDFSDEKTITVDNASKGYDSQYVFTTVKQGDTIKFGAYEQDNDLTNGKEPIEWIVLSKDDKGILALSKYALECLPYNASITDVVWENCSLRKWLNDEFFNAAFNKTEQAMIKTTVVENYDNVIYGTAGGEDTKDKVFLLSQLDMINTDYGFSSDYNAKDDMRRCASTAYAVARGGFVSDYLTVNGEKSGYWWLRSPGRVATAAAGVHEQGYVDSQGNGYGHSLGVSDDDNVVRPAIYLELISSEVKEDKSAKSDDQARTDADDEADNVFLSGTKNTLSVGEKMTLTLENAIGSTSWKSSSTKVLTVKKGVVTAVGIGTATITATNNGIKYKCKVTVTGEAGLNYTTATISIGDTLKLKVSGANAVSFTSSKKSVAKVKASGAVIAKKAGKTTIKVKCDNGETYTCKVTVKK